MFLHAFADCVAYFCHDVCLLGVSYASSGQWAASHIDVLNVHDPEIRRVDDSVSPSVASGVLLSCHLSLFTHHPLVRDGSSSADEIAG